MKNSIINFIKIISSTIYNSLDNYLEKLGDSGEVKIIMEADRKGKVLKPIDIRVIDYPLNNVRVDQKFLRERGVIGEGVVVDLAEVHDYLDGKIVTFFIEGDDLNSSDITNFGNISEYILSFHIKIVSKIEIHDSRLFFHTLDIKVG